jgi:hypothetical protein
MAIQVGANDGQTINIDLQKSTLLLWAWTAFCVTVLKALQLHWLVQLMTSNPTAGATTNVLQQLFGEKAPTDDLSRVWAWLRGLMLWLILQCL